VNYEKTNRSWELVNLWWILYPAWKVQCRMMLMKDGLWNIVNGTELDPGGGEDEAHKKFMSR